MALVNQLSTSNRRRDNLSNNRNGFTYAANITVLSLALLFFIIIDNNIDQFRYLIFSTVALGVVSSLFFMFTINEPKLTQQAVHYD